ncbi:hypothetical protein ET445_11295 [Agromyces protaetiae]|uniref:DUF2231 domain-containing protein n=1 Tax=Agromyces protaetiae TaxID=2509455 RepID=A0A4P6FFI4_9MICO|nr:hypothetical protein [Agromyces protaetiae]QAY73843.1 hypothetical protein ET445_11295 [Agromyces protaetiae]
MDYEFAGLPLHILLIHVVVVAIPLLGLLLLVVAVWPAARRVLWVPCLLGGLAILPLVLVTVEAGKWLEARVPAAPLIQEHANQGPDLIPWAVGLLVLAIAVAVWAVVELVAKRRSRALSRGAVLGVSALLTVAALVVGIGSTITLVRIAEAGSRAVWQGTFSDVPLD